MTRLDTWRLPLPRGGAIALGVLAIATGLLTLGSLFIAPAAVTACLAVGCLLLGLFRLSRAESPWLSLAGITWAACGIAIVLWPGHGLRATGTIAAIGLLVDGIGTCITHYTGTDRSLRSLILPIATILAGIASLIWVGVSILPVCVITGTVFLIRGIGVILNARHTRRSFRAGFVQTAGALLAAVVAFAAMGSGAWVRSSLPEPTSFYQAPDELPAEPGVLLRSTPYEHEQVPEGARAWRILYTTTLDDDTPAVSSGLVIAPGGDAASTPSGVIAWSHGTTGFAEGCAPSLLANSLESGAMFVVDEVIERGWTLVATDYIGLGTEGPHPYLIGEPTGRSVLDAVRAARQLETLALSDQTVVWGHSQGGHGALWTGIVSAEGYAPDVPILGVAAAAPAANITALVNSLPAITGGSLFGAYVLRAYDEVYDDVDMDDYLKPSAKVSIMEFSERCLSGPALLVSIATLPFVPGTVWDSDPTSGPLGERLTQNIPTGTIDVPVLLAQGLDDRLILPAGQQAYVQWRCESDTNIVYREYEGRDHVPLVEADSPLIPDLMQWTQDRFNGAAQTSTCGG